MPLSGAQFRVRFAFSASKYDPGSSAGAVVSNSGRTLRPSTAPNVTPTRSRIVGVMSTNRTGDATLAGAIVPGAQMTSGTRSVDS